MRRGSDIKTEKGNAVDDQQPLELLAKKERWMYGPHEAIRTDRVREIALPIRKQAVAPIQREIRLRVQSLEKAYVQDLEGRGPVGMEEIRLEMPSILGARESLHLAQRRAGIQLEREGADLRGVLSVQPQGKVGRLERERTQDSQCQSGSQNGAPRARTQADGEGRLDRDNQGAEKRELPRQVRLKRDGDDRHNPERGPFSDDRGFAGDPRHHQRNSRYAADQVEELQMRRQMPAEIDP